MYAIAHFLIDNNIADNRGRYKPGDWVNYNWKARAIIPKLFAEYPGPRQVSKVLYSDKTGLEFTDGSGCDPFWVSPCAPPESLTDKKPKVKHDWIGRTNYCSRCGEYQTKYNNEDYCLTDKSKV